MHLPQPLRAFYPIQLTVGNGNEHELPEPVNAHVSCPTISLPSIWRTGTDSYSHVRRDLSAMNTHSWVGRHLP